MGTFGTEMKGPVSRHIFIFAYEDSHTFIPKDTITTSFTVVTRYQRDVGIILKRTGIS